MSQSRDSKSIYKGWDWQSTSYKANYKTRYRMGDFMNNKKNINSLGM